MDSGSITNPQSNNLYAYVGNNPVDYVDPSGLNAALNDRIGGSGYCWYISEFINEKWVLVGVHCMDTNGGSGGGDTGGGGGDSTPTFGNRGAFTDNQMDKIKAALKFINSWACKDAINKIIKSKDAMAGQPYKDADALISGVELNRFDSSMSANDMGISDPQRKDVTDADGYLSYPMGFGVPDTNRIWLNATVGWGILPNAFDESTDLPTIIVHDLLHKVLGQDEKLLSKYRGEIVRNCMDDNPKSKVTLGL